MRILITSGAARERIDAVRYITNFSSGKTGAELADYFRRKKCEVLYFHGKSSAVPLNRVTCVEFGGFKDLNDKLKFILKNNRFDAIIHLAAVSDYSVESVTTGSKYRRPEKLSKIDSEDEVSIKLKKNFKIIGRLADYSVGNAARPLIVGFKLTCNARKKQIEKAVQKLRSEGNADIVVHNDLSEFNGGENRMFHIYESGKPVKTCASRKELAAGLFGLVKRRTITGEKNAIDS